MGPLLSALHFLTTIPLLPKRPYSKEEFGKAVSYFPLVGLIIGGVIGALWKERSRMKKEALIHAIEHMPPEQLLDLHKHNFKLQPFDFKDSHIQPASLFASHGPHAGRWKSVLRNGKKLTLEFLTNEDMQIALSLLPHTIGPVVKINVLWDDKKQKFTKRV